MKGGHLKGLGSGWVTEGRSCKAQNWFGLGRVYELLIGGHSKVNGLKQVN